MNFSADAVLALAPDEASAKAARSLTAAGQWPVRGHNDAAVWGECQGSGAKPYQTQVDLNGPVFRCSCPSRKFPCKHGLALLLMRAQDGATFQSGEPPAWVAEWLASRQQRAQKAEAKAEVREQREAERAADPQAAAAAADADAAAAAARAAQRWARIDAGLADLERWMGDAVQRGLANLAPDSAEQWTRFAARLVDAQAPGLAAPVRDCAGLIRAGAAGLQDLLATLGRLQLVVEAARRRDHLSSDVRADLRATLGWPLDLDEVLARGDPVADDWTVLGQVSQELDHRLVERRVWLSGQASGRRALVLDFAAGGQGFETAWLTGAAMRATLAFYPSRVPLRALLVQRDAAPIDAVWPQPRAELEWQALAQRLAGHAWLPLAPLVLTDAVPQGSGAPWSAVTRGTRVPLALADDDAWMLMAASGGHPVTLAGEWDGRCLRPFSAWGGEGLWTLGTARLS